MAMGLKARRPGSTIRIFTRFLSSLDWEHAMSFFGKIMGAIFGSHASAAPASGGAAPAGGPAAPASTGSSSAPAAPMGSGDVAAIVDKAAPSKGQKLAWRTSILHLMKALDIDSSPTD